MPQSSAGSLWLALSRGPHLAGRFFAGAGATIPLGDLLSGSVLNCGDEELRGKSVLVATTDQLAAAAAVIELDGIVRRIVLFPPDAPQEHLRFTAEAANADVIVTDRDLELSDRRVIRCAVPHDAKLPCADFDRTPRWATEWVLLTSGTTGRPKLVLHTLDTLVSAFERSGAPESPVVWSTFYDIRRFGGLQIFLRSLFNATSFVLSDSREPAAEFLRRAGSLGATHISGTPSHWRRALMTSAAGLIAPYYVRLSGEIANQEILSQLGSFYPGARVAHAFASTEAGLAFEVNDGRAGFPAATIGRMPQVEMKVEDGSLRIRSRRTAIDYLGEHSGMLKDADGFIDTGDMLDFRQGRYYFAGRRDGMINVGGQKVHPEEVETVINRHPQVDMSLVRTRRNPITGALVVADVVLKESAAGAGAPELRHAILTFCRKQLPLHKVPATINFVSRLAISETGKLNRNA